MKLTRLDLIAICMALLVPAAAWFGFFKGRVAELNRLRTEQAALEEQTAGGSKTAVDLLAVRGKLRKITERLNAFTGSVSDGDEAFKAVDAVLQDAKDAGIGIDSLRPGKLVAGATLNSVPIQLTASSEFPKFYNFLARIERNKVVITVDRMELESDPLSGKCAVKLELRAHFIQLAGKEKQA